MEYKAGKRRIVLSPTTIETLRQHHQRLRDEAQKGPLVLPSLAGTYLLGANVLKSFQTIVKSCGLPAITLHSLRHSSASVLIAAGASAKVVQERLGHSKVDTTLSIYTHLFTSGQDAAADVFAAKLHNKKGTPTQPTLEEDGEAG